MGCAFLGPQGIFVLNFPGEIESQLNGGVVGIIFSIMIADVLPVSKVGSDGKVGHSQECSVIPLVILLTSVGVLVWERDFHPWKLGFFLQRTKGRSYTMQVGEWYKRRRFWWLCLASWCLSLCSPSEDVHQLMEERIKKDLQVHYYSNVTSDMRRSSSYLLFECQSLAVSVKRPTVALCESKFLGTLPEGHRWVSFRLLEWSFWLGLFCFVWVLGFF